MPISSAGVELLSVVRDFLVAVEFLIRDSTDYLEANNRLAVSIEDRFCDRLRLCPPGSRR